ncbi:MAG: aminobenzoyl-glutamate transporter [Ignavibacteriae bacterium HGW-Ignavibacteriae-4]|jgi:aminobenzoyl-glutamate transport protein|nr:MAG: aminobenzoyl-glutamate transporter [Ignavibacteriae bacterium HGW-Ignavibacteriae-4]
MKNNKNLIFSFLKRVEKVSDKLPNPFFLFIILALFTILLSVLFNLLGTSVVHPVTNETIVVKSILSVDGLREVLTSAVKNFINFPPLGVVLATMFGIIVAEKSGLFEATLKYTISKVPDSFVVFTIVFVSVNSSLIADAGLIVLPPLAGLTYRAIGKNPLAGVITSFAAINGGFSANLLITALDPLLSGLTHQAAQTIDSSYNVYPTANYYFMFVSTFLVAIVCTVVNNKIVEPRLGKYKPDITNDVNKESSFIIHKKALFYSYLLFFAILIVIAALSIPENAFFRDENGELTYLFKSIIPIIILIFFFPGLVYGRISGTIKSSSDIVDMLNSGMGTMASYIVIAFAAGQFLHYFNWSELDMVIAVKGAGFISNIGLSGLPLFLTFLVFSMLLNLSISSASAKWAILAPVFVPMFMILGITPEATQLIYRIGDSTTNMITPLLPYFPLLIVFAQKFKKDVSMGELISSLLPFSIALFLAWSLLLGVWYIFNFQIGPNVSFFLK